jgi:hypothetical protein
MKTLNQFFIGPELFLLFTLSGIFFLFPTNSRRAYFLVIPMGQTLAKLFIFITATSNVLRIREADNCVGLWAGIGGLLYTLLPPVLLTNLI